MAVEQFKILDEADQQFETIVNGLRVTVRLRYNTRIDRWTFDLSISSVVVLTGRKLVPDIDLLAPYNFGVGQMICGSGTINDVPTYDKLVNGTVGFYSAV